MQVKIKWLQVGKITVVVAMLIAVIIAPHLGIDKKGGFRIHSRIYWICKSRDFCHVYSRIFLEENKFECGNVCYDWWIYHVGDF